MKVLFTFITLLFLNSCIPIGQETERYELGNEERQTIPYMAGETVTFSHSNGFEFDLKVSGKDTKFQKSEIQHAGDDYITYEETVHLSVSANFTNK